jgi:hypothetical protein
MRDAALMLADRFAATDAPPLAPGHSIVAAWTIALDSVFRWRSFAVDTPLAPHRDGADG